MTNYIKTVVKTVVLLAALCTTGLAAAGDSNREHGVITGFMHGENLVKIGAHYYRVGAATRIQDEGERVQIPVESLFQGMSVAFQATGQPGGSLRELTNVWVYAD